MSIGTVQEVGKTQKGTPKIKIDNAWIIAGRCPVDGLQSGAKVEYQTSSKIGTNGTPMFFLESWKPILNGEGKPAHGPSDDAEMRFISNCVGQAIAAGTLKEPGDISVWFKAAKAALAPRDELDDDIPY